MTFYVSSPKAKPSPLVAMTANTARKPGFLNPVPRHVAIIMDGNGRWARHRGLPHLAGHEQGAEALRSVLETAGKIGVAYLTVYGFSSENWRRSPQEIAGLMQLLRVYLKRELVELHGAGVRLRVIGERTRLEDDITTMIAAAEKQTENNTKLHFTVALNYGGRADILNAVRTLARKVSARTLDCDDIDEHLFCAHLDTADLPDPDLLIRTSGELRISNFLLWQSAYTEFAFSEKLWPDFRGDDLRTIIDEFRARERRFGG